MFCSIIIPTVGRPSLANSVESVIKQDFIHDDYEIIVVNDSGQPLPPANWQASNKVQIICTQQRERCFARNSGAACAKGAYFCFLDDDDWLLPNALTNFWKLINANPEAKWVYGGVEFVDNANKHLGFLNQRKTGNCFIEVMTETWIPIQASLIEAQTFFNVGGFDHEYVGTEDLNLLRHISLMHNLVHTSENIACMQRGCARKSETEYSVGWYYIAKGRDTLLAHENALPRLLNSAGKSAYLHGLVLRNYKQATLFNLRRHHWLTAMSRFSTGIKSWMKSLKYMFTKDYWQAVLGSRPLHLSLIGSPSPDYESVEEWLFS